MNEWAVMWESLVDSGVPEQDATRRVQAAQAAATAQQAQDWAVMWERLVDAGVPEEGATQRVLQAQRPLDQETRRELGGDVVNNAMARGDTATARMAVEEYERTNAAAPPAVTSSGAGGDWGAREIGRAEGREGTALEAAAHGAGSMLFGVGTPVYAAAKMLTSAAPGGTPIMGPGEAMEYARGRREGMYEAQPGSYRVGALAGLFTGAEAAGKAVARAPAAVRSVFQLQRGQTKRNIARLAATGAATAGATAAVQEGIDAAAPAAIAGGVLSPVAVGIPAAAVGVGSAIKARISPNNAAIRALAKRFKESETRLAALYNNFVERTGRRPGLAEIVTEVEAGRVGQVGAQFSRAGRVFREAEMAAADARPNEMRAFVERGGATTTVAEQQARLAPVTEATREVVGSRVRSSEAAQFARRNTAMDRVMETLRHHRVPLTDDMLEVVADPDVQSALSPALRRRVINALEQGQTIGSIDLSVGTWEMMRQALAGKAGPGAGQIFSRLRDRVRDYVSDHVPEYGRALREFGRRSVGADATAAAQRGVSGSAREFADMLRLSGEEVHGTTARAASRVGVRNWLSDQLSSSPQSAERVMKRLARDRGLRANLRSALSEDELARLELLGNEYNLRLNVLEGAQVGAKVMKGDAAMFEDAVREASGRAHGARGVREAARGAAAGKVGESPATAISTAHSLAKDPGLLRRLEVALGAPEAGRLRQMGASANQAARNLRAATPHAGQAQQEATEQAQQAYNVITAAVAMSGTASGALKAHLAQRIMQRIGLGSKAAERLAEFATDPARAEEAIRRIRAAGVSAEEMLMWYQGAAAVAGVKVGSWTDGER